MTYIKLSKYLISLFLIILISFTAFHIFKGFRNNENIKEIKIGMSKFEMLDIMGQPNNIENDPLDKNHLRYFYEPQIGASDGIYVIIGPDNKVVNINKSD